MTDPRVLIGTSGWVYPSWRGTVYPAGLAQSRWLSAYAEEFPVVEVNATFYRLAREPTVRRWAESVPPSFRFVVKGSRFLTHTRKLEDTDRGLRRFFTPLAPLRELLSAVLWQLPPWMSIDVDRLRRFLDAAAMVGGGVQHAVEFRHASWQTGEAYAALDERGAMTVNVSGPQLPEDHVVTGERAYVRFHGLSKGYAHDYSTDELRPWAEHLRAQPAALAFFNNDAGGRAVANARQLRALVGAPAVASPLLTASKARD